MKSIIINTLKISVAAILAILCAQALKLDFAVSAGIVAILSVQPTKKETLRTALARLLAFAVALVISATLQSSRLHYSSLFSLPCDFYFSLPVAQMDFSHGNGLSFDFTFSYVRQNRPNGNQK